MCTPRLVQWIIEIFSAFTKPSALQELMHILRKRANLNSKITWKDSKGKKRAAKKERKKSCPPPRGNVCFLPVPPCLQRERTGSLSCFPPFTYLSTDLLRTNKRVEQLFHYPLTQGFSESLFPRWVSSFCCLMHMAMVLRSSMMLEQWLLLLLSNYLFLLSSILQALNSITFTE